MYNKADKAFEIITALIWSSMAVGYFFGTGWGFLVLTRVQANVGEQLTIFFFTATFAIAGFGVCFVVGSFIMSFFTRKLMKIFNEEEKGQN